MAYLYVAPRAALAPGASARLLIGALPLNSGPFGGAAGGLAVSAVAGLSGWWDASGPGGLLDANGAPLVAMGNTVGAIVDKSGGGTALFPYHDAVDTTPNPTLGVARLNGFLGGVGSPGATIAQYGPTLDPDWGLTHPALELGAAAAWTRVLVWTRPNWRQGTIQVNANPIPLLHATAAGTTVLQADSAGGTTLKLFPGTAAETVLTSTLARRHSHAVILRNTPGSGVDVWLDSVEVASGIANPLPGSCIGQVLLFHDSTIQGSAQCWFHEAACWERALSAADIATLNGALGRWSLGTRRGIDVLVMGQSNAEWFVNSGAPVALAQGVAWYLGAVAYGVVAQQSGNAVNPSRYSMVAGHPISNSSPPLFPPGIGNGTFLTNPGDGSATSGWAGGPDFQALSAYVTGASALVPSADLGDIAFMIWPWSEQDSTMPYANKALYEGTVLRLAALTRGIFGRSAATMPLLMWNAIPYETDAGVQMVRESVADLAASAANEVIVFAPQTADSNPLNAVWDPTTGVFSGGDPQHRDQPDLLRYGRMGCHAAARAAIAMGLSDSIPASALPASGLPVRGGPLIQHAYRASNTEIILTVAHDSGTDLIVPLQAANGVGFTAMDGGSVASPGPLIDAVAAARVDATHLSITLGAALTQASADVLLFYPYGSRQIGRGDAVTDNAASIPLPAGWDIGADLGAAFVQNFPLQATTYPIVLSDTPI